MKKIMITVATALFVSGINAQSIYDATKIASKDLNGTARFVGMGGAMSALGGDISTTVSYTHLTLPTICSV